MLQYFKDQLMTRLNYGKIMILKFENKVEEDKS